MKATTDVKELPFRAFELEEQEIAFVGDFEYGDRDDLEYYAERCQAEIANDVAAADLVVYGANADAERAAASAAGIGCLSEEEFLNVVDLASTTFPQVVEQLVAQRFDITTFSNEGDGFLETLDWQIPAPIADLDEMLLTYARTSPAVTKEMENSRNIGYARHHLESQRDDLQPLVDSDKARGWCEFRSLSNFEWRLVACSETTWISGVSLLRILRQHVSEVGVLAVRDKPIDDNVTTLFVCGGPDDRGHLVGFVLNHTQT